MIIPAPRCYDYTHLTDADLARLRRIETAAGEVLASGQARYEVPPPGALPCLLGDPESRYVGDLVPAAAMQALREAVDGETTAAGRDGCERGETIR